MTSYQVLRDRQVLPDKIDPTWSRYRDNFPRQIQGVTRYLDSHVMERLTERHGFTDLRLYFEPYISLATNEGVRLTDLAKTLGISRQAVNQTANQIASAGYIKRVPDPDDGRAKRIVLTRRGSELRKQGLALAKQLECQFSEIVGQDRLDKSVAALADFCTSVNIMPPVLTHTQNGKASLVALLPRFSDYISQRLMDTTIERGHRGLKLSYAKVLALIGPKGGRIQQIATLQNVTKQAISAVASELEAEGYIYREPDPQDARQILLRFTPLGRKLIEDSVAGIDDLESEIQSIIGTDALNALRGAMKDLYYTLQPEVAVFTCSSPDVAQLNRELREKLSPEARRQLARLLLDS